MPDRGPDGRLDDTVDRALFAEAQVRRLMAEIERLRSVLHGIAVSDHEGYPPTASQLRTRAFVALRDAS